jgi:undecaprenyl-phosphate galactose phosphotransferase
MVIVFCSQGIYRSRFDFWQESHRVIKGLFFSIILILSFLAVTKQAAEYSRFILVVSFMVAGVLIPFQKLWVKRFLYRLGWWKKEARLVGEDPFFEQHVFSNPYLGYVHSTQEKAKTLFIASSYSYEKIETILHEALLRKQSVIFIPTVKNFDFSDAHIIHLFNARANLIIVENNLLNRSNRLIKGILDYCLALSILPFLLFLIGIIAWKIKKEDGGSIFFKQLRLGEKGETFECYKFRSMRENSDPLLEAYLEKNPQERENYAIYHKYDNDPRITKIGTFLRKTSLDELPQIFNVLKREMSLIGPRPYMMSEKKKMIKNVEMILAVKPGITGLWQVSGRSDIDFESRMEMDVWYVRNWSIWSDIVILIKTIQVVVLRKGAS